jgi:hypothetical protein
MEQEQKFFDKDTMFVMTDDDFNADILLKTADTLEEPELFAETCGYRELAVNRKLFFENYTKYRKDLSAKLQEFTTKMLGDHPLTEQENLAWQETGKMYDSIERIKNILEQGDEVEYLLMDTES